VRVDRLREVGRGVRDQGPSVGQLCGRCADGVLAVTPGGDVMPCVLARWLVLGNTRSGSLAVINQRAGTVRQELAGAFAVLADNKDCPPKDTGPPCPPNFKKPEPCGPERDGTPPKK
jgi:hypothetical protein